MTRWASQRADRSGISEVRQTCSFNCGSRCLLRLQVRDGKILWVETDNGEEASGVPRMRACLRGRALRYWVDCPERLNEPLRRVGPRGSGLFEPVSWDEALDEIASRIEHTVKTWGNEAVLIPYATAIWSASGSPFERLMNCYGGHLGIYGDYSCMQLQAACDLLYGDDGYYSGSTLDEAAHADLVVFFGANPALTRMGGASGTYRFARARERALAEGRPFKTVAIDPYQSDAVIQEGDEWIPIRPGTDAAFVAGVAYVLITEGLVDEEFVHRYCVGYDAPTMPEGVDATEGYKSYVLGDASDGVPKTPTWAARITGCPSTRIATFAHELAHARRAFVMQGWGPQRTACGEQSARAICLLAILTGNIGLPGTNGGARERLFAPCLPDDFVGENPVKTTIPAFSWSRAVFDAAKMTRDDAGVRGSDGLSVPVKLIINHAGNALTNQHADINRTHEILADESLCEFIVGIDVVMTDSMRYADIILPDVAQVEQASLRASGNSDGLRAVIGCESWDVDLHDRRPAWDVARDLARRLGVEESFCSRGSSHVESEESRWAESDLSKCEHASDALSKDGLVLQSQELGMVAYRAFREDPDANPLPTPSGKIEIYSQRVAERMSCMDHDQTRMMSPIPAYVPDPEGAEVAADGSFPFQFITHHGRQSVHSSMANVREIEAVTARRLLINPVDAGVLRIGPEMPVVVENGRGALVCRVRITPRIMPGVVSLPEGGWHDADMEGDRLDWGACANTLTSDEPTVWSHGNPHNSCLVRIRLLSDAEREELERREGHEGGESA